MYRDTTGGHKILTKSIDGVSESLCIEIQRVVIKILSKSIDGVSESSCIEIQRVVIKFSLNLLMA